MSKTSYQKLSNCPIQLAIFQTSYNTEQEFPYQNINDFVQSVKSIFPFFLPGLNRTVALDKVKESDTTVKLSKGVVDRYTFESPDKLTTLVILNNSFILNLKKYTSWEDHMPMYMEMWELFTKLCLKKQFIINRASIRYINRLEISDMVDPSLYFNTTIYASESVIPGVVESFLMRYQANSAETNVQSHVTQGFEPPIGTISPYVFDIDTISQSRQIPFNDLLVEFEKLREVKNKTFFSNLTEKTLSLLL